MAKICTLIAIPSEIIEGSTFDVLNVEWPNAACHDGRNKIFNGTDINAINPLVLHEALPPEDDEESYIDRVVAFLSPILYAEDRTRPIHIFKSIMSQLYNHPVYQAFIEEMNPTQEEQLTNINKEP